MHDFTEIIDVLGTISFAISGVLAAVKKRMDIFGVLIIAVVTSVGGGTLRDLLIGKTPVTWMLNTTFIYLILVTVVIALVFRKKLKYFRNTLFIFDTIGIALYTITGVQIGLTVGMDAIICVALGTMTACFGGVLRDILCAEIPIIFRKEIYASACIAGGIVYLSFVAIGIPTVLTAILAGLTVVVIRVLAVHYSLSLPSLYPKGDRMED